MMFAPPLGVVTGTVLPGEVFGRFGPASAFQWRGSCVGGCGGRPGCAAEYPRPECSGCARVRHDLTAETPRVPWAPVVNLAAPTRPRRGPDAAPTPDRWTVLRPAVEISPHDPSLPATVRRLVESAPGLRMFVAVAADVEGAALASMSVRAPGVGYVVYERQEGGTWRYARGAVLAPRPRHRLPARPHLMRANVGRFTAALAGVEYESAPVLDVEPRAATPKGKCASCGAEVSLTKAGAVYASHKCQSKTVEGRS